MKRIILIFIIFVFCASPTKVAEPNNDIRLIGEWHFTFLTGKFIFTKSNINKYINDSLWWNGIYLTYNNRFIKMTNNNSLKDSSDYSIYEINADSLRISPNVTIYVSNNNKGINGKWISTYDTSFSFEILNSSQVRFVDDSITISGNYVFNDTTIKFTSDSIPVHPKKSYCCLINDTLLVGTIDTNVIIQLIKG